MTDGAVLVTGAQRSGTTLLAKLLNTRDRLSILSQPFPLLFTEVKGAFLRTLGHDDRYPLGHLFLENRYSGEAFGRFLHEWRTTPEELRPLFARMTGYSGQYTRFTDAQLEEALSRIPPDAGFAEVVASLDRSLSGDADAEVFGSKETICEEYVPPLLDRGFRCVILIRDPRDVVASLNHGRGSKFAGELKPTLFNIRSWRKSVAFALAMDGHPRFAWCRYEDLVANPGGELSRLGLGTFSTAAEVRDANGDVWRGNSSHGEMHGISAASVGAHRSMLPAPVAQWIEAACLPELRCLGYETTLTRETATHVLEQFREHYTITRMGMEADAATPANVVLETQRLERAAQAPGEKSARWFLFPQTHVRLREALRE
jgi:hypothetical protein